MISDWALMADGQGLILNWYGASAMTTKVKGVSVTLQQETDYPRNGIIKLKVLPSKEMEFDLKLRIPYWSKKSNVSVNDTLLKDVAPGGYLVLRRRWKKTDTVRIELDMSLHYWVGEKECDGKTSIYRGPVLLAHNPVEDTKKEIIFKGNWKQYKSRRYTDQPGALIEYTFEGDKVRWVGYRFDNAGKAQVKIDGKEVAIVDQYGPQYEMPFVWEYSGLGAGKHRIEIIVTGQRNEKSKGICLNIRKFSHKDIVTLDAENMKGRMVETEGDSAPLVLMEFSDVYGNKVNLSDFNSAGEDGREYISWLKVLNAPKVPFSKTNPLRSGR